MNSALHVDTREALCVNKRQYFLELAQGASGKILPALTALLNLNSFNGSPQFSDWIPTLADTALLDLDSSLLRSLTSQHSPTLLSPVTLSNSHTYACICSSLPRTFLPTPISFKTLDRCCLLRDNPSYLPPTSPPRSVRHSCPGLPMMVYYFLVPARGCSWRGEPYLFLFGPRCKDLAHTRCLKKYVIIRLKSNGEQLLGPETQ